MAQVVGRAFGADKADRPSWARATRAKTERAGRMLCFVERGLFVQLATRWVGFDVSRRCMKTRL